MNSTRRTRLPSGPASAALTAVLALPVTAAPDIISVEICGPMCVPDDETPQEYTIIVKGKGPGAYRYSVLDDDGPLVDDTLVDERTGIPPFTCIGDTWEQEFTIELWCDTTFEDEVEGPDGCSDEGEDCSNPAEVYVLIENQFGADLKESSRIDVCCCPAGTSSGFHLPQLQWPGWEEGRAPRASAGYVRSMEYDFGSGRALQRMGAPLKRSAAEACYVNVDTSGGFTPAPIATEIIDWGILGGINTTLCSGISPIVQSFNFAYGTTSVDTSVGGPGANLTLKFYTGYSGFGADSGNSPVATFAFTGLPGSSGCSTGAGYEFSVDLTGGFEFVLPDGRFGFGAKGDGNTGPLLCYTGDGFGGFEPPTGNRDAFDVWVPDTRGVYVGTVDMGGPPNNYSSFYAAVGRANLAATPASSVTRNGATNKPNSLFCSPPVLGRTMAITALCPQAYLAVILLAFDSPVNFVLAGGQTLLCFDLGGNGELFTGGGMTGNLTGTSGGCRIFTATVDMTTDVTACGGSFCVQGICAFGVTPFAMTSACDVVIGG